MLQLLIQLDVEDTYSDTDSDCEGDAGESPYIEFSETFDVCWNDDDDDAVDATCDGNDFDFDDDDDDVQEFEKTADGGFRTVYNVWWNDDEEADVVTQERCILTPCIMTEHLAVKESIASPSGSGDMTYNTTAKAVVLVKAAYADMHKAEASAFSPRSVVERSMSITAGSAVKVARSAETCISQQGTVPSAAIASLTWRDTAKSDDCVEWVPAGKWESLKAVEWCKRHGPLRAL